MERHSWPGKFLRTAGLVVLVVIMPLTLGYLLSLYLFPTPQIAVIRVEGDIWGFYTAALSDALEEAKSDRAVRGVVLDISSPGGEVTASEGLYFDVLSLREAVPVVASVDEMAASGAYYVASAADRIYAKPASMVGNIGVISFLPPPDLVDEQLITTGPFKLSGGPEVAYIRQMEMMKETFLSAIVAQRRARLRVDSDVLSRGEIYLGLQAERMGLIDEIGSQGDAVAFAASMAKLRDYDVVDLTPELPEDEALFAFRFRTGSTAATLAAPPKNLPPGFYYRYVEPLQ
ncbi:S49 family peptidase [Chloroflexota bacterium]